MRTLAVVIFMTCNLQAFCDRNDPSLKLCWDGLEGHGLIVRDGSSLGLNGTLTGGPAWVTSESDNPHSREKDLVFSSSTISWFWGPRLSFSGAAGVDVRSADSAVFDSPARMIVAITFKPAIFPTNLEQSLVGYGDGTALNGNWQCSILAGGIGAVGSFNFRYTGVQNNIFTGSGIQKATETHRVAMVKNGDASADKTYCYLDGIQNGVSVNGAAMTSVGTKRVAMSFSDDGDSSGFIGQLGFLKIWINREPFRSKEEQDAFMYNDWMIHLVHLGPNRAAVYR